MYQKFLPNGSAGMQVFSRSNLESVVAISNIPDDIRVIGHTLETPDLDSAMVINHTLVIE